MSESHATIEYLEEQHENRRMMPCVYAECEESGDRAGPVWGSGPSSIRRALAMLSESCSCGASFHRDADEDEEDDE